MITQNDAQELLHRAYILAIAAQAGFNVEGSGEFDFGLDGSFKAVTEVIDVNGVRSFLEMGSLLRFQGKSTTSCRTTKTHINYSCDAKAYNKIVLQNAEATIHTILLVFCLPSNRDDWLEVTEDSLKMGGACYWYYLSGPQTRNKREQVVSIPRSQLFTAAALTDIMKRIQGKGKP